MSRKSSDAGYFAACHAAYHIAAALAFCVVWAATGTVLKVLVVPDDVRDVASALTSWVFITLPFGVAVYLALVGIEHAIYYFMTARQREAQLATARLASSGSRCARARRRSDAHFWSARAVASSSGFAVTGLPVACCIHRSGRMLPSRHTRSNSFANVALFLPATCSSTWNAMTWPTT
jgi:hypothetical protein